MPVGLCHLEGSKKFWGVMKLFRGQGSQMPGTPRRWSLALRYVGQNRRYKCLRNLHLIPILPAGEFNPSEPDFFVKQGQFTGLHSFGKGWGSGGEGTLAGLVLEGTNTAASGQAVFPSWCQRQDPVGGMSTQRGTPARWFGSSRSSATAGSAVPKQATDLVDDPSKKCSWWQHWRCKYTPAAVSQGGDQMGHTSPAEDAVRISRGVWVTTVLLSHRLKEFWGLSHVRFCTDGN